MSRQAVIRVGPGDSKLLAHMLGRRLAEKRKAANLTGKEVAKRLRRGGASVSRWESGDEIPKPGDLLLILQEYGVTGAERDALTRLAEEAHERREAPETVSAALADYGWLQSRAFKLESFQDAGVPDLLQTAEYAREILKAWDPTAGRDRIERTLRTRMARRERLQGDDPVQVRAVVTEAVLRQSIGGPAVMRAQLLHLLDCAAMPNVEVRVLPFSAGAHPGLTGPFTILRFHDVADLVRVVTRGGDVYFEDAEPFARTLRRIRAAAVPHRESVAMIAAIAKETR